MMTQSYYGEGFDAFGRPCQRAPASAAYYERQNPYTHSYYDTPHQEVRSEYVVRNGSHALNQEQGSDHGPPGLQRRRIQVACSRCRRRKIKCTGDPGDGSGCSACRSAGADRSTCTFNRVGSHSLSSQVIDLLPTPSRARSITPTPVANSTESVASSYDNGLYPRPSLPILQTRSAYGDYDPYGTSPPQDYSYSTSSTPRQPTYSSSYGAESFRPWLAGSASAPGTSTSMFYESGASFGESFGSLQAAPTYAPAATNRLPRVSSEALSPLNMASMHSSLPSQTVQERTLPAPFTVTTAPPAYDISGVPQIRPLGSFTKPRPHINGIYSRNSMPWSSDAQIGSSSTVRAPSLSSLPIPALGSASSGSSSSSYTSDPILGYQFSTSTGSPTISPTAGPALSQSFPSASSIAASTSSSMLPPSRRRVLRGSSHPNLPSLIGGNDDYRRSSPSSQEAAASLYSFSTDIDTSDRHSARHHHYNNNDRDDHSQSQNGYTTYRHSQPQHAASLDELRRRSSCDQQQQQQRPTTAHRMSVSNLHARH